MTTQTTQPQNQQQNQQPVFLPGNHQKTGLADDRQLSWNTLVDRARQGNYNDRSKLVTAACQRWQDALAIHNRYPNSFTLSQVSLKWRDLYRDLDTMLRRAGRMQTWDLDALVEHPIFQPAGTKGAVWLAAFSRVDLINYLAGVERGTGTGWKRGLMEEELNCYCTIQVADEDYLFRQGKHTIIISAETLYQMQCSAVTGTHQDAPVTSAGVLGKSGLYDGFTFVLPAGFFFTSVSGKQYTLPHAMRISLPFNESVWNFEAVACAMHNYQVSEENRQELMNLRATALQQCFAEVNEGHLQPRGKWQLERVQAMYIWLKNPEKAFAPGGYLFGLQEADLFDDACFEQAWTQRQERREAEREAKRTTSQNKATPASEPTNAKQVSLVADDYDPCFGDDSEEGEPER